MSTDVNSTLAALAIMPVTVLASIHLILQVKTNFEQHMLEDCWMAKKNKSPNYLAILYIFVTRNTVLITYMCMGS